MVGLYNSKVRLGLKKYFSDFLKYFSGLSRNTEKNIKQMLHLRFLILFYLFFKDNTYHKSQVDFALSIQRYIAT